MSKYIVEREKLHFASIGEPYGAWNEGYISALANYDIISESEFDELMEFCKAGWLAKSAEINEELDGIQKAFPAPWYGKVLGHLKRIFTVFKY